MLTDSEREWLKARNIAHPDGDYFCEHCDVFAECHMYWPIECPTKLSIKPEDIAFEARVAAKLAKAYELLASKCEGYVFDPCSFCRINVVKTLSCMPSCADTVLRRMRIEVEEEMNGNVCKMDTA